MKPSSDIPFGFTYLKEGSLWDNIIDAGLLDNILILCQEDVMISWASTRLRCVIAHLYRKDLPSKKST